MNVKTEFFKRSINVGILRFKKKIFEMINWWERRKNDQFWSRRSKLALVDRLFAYKILSEIEGSKPEILRWSSWDLILVQKDTRHDQHGPKLLANSIYTVFQDKLNQEKKVLFFLPWILANCWWDS